MRGALFLNIMPTTSAPFYERRFDFLVDFNEGLQRTVCGWLDLKTPVKPTEAYLDATAETVAAFVSSAAATGQTVTAAGLTVADLRETIRPKRPYADDAAFEAVPYWQVFASRLDFLPNLSIVDLLFNVGPEARLVLRDSCSAG